MTLIKTKLQIESEYKQLRTVKARKHFQNFVSYTYEGYEMEWFHKLVCAYLDALYQGRIKKLMIFIPPQHGKSELSSRRFPAYLLGRNPDLQIGLCSYSADLASSFNRSVQMIMDDPDYYELYPDTRLNGKRVSTDTGSGVLRNSEIFQIVGKKGYLKTVGVGGSLTGFRLDVGIIDDPFKDRMEANSPTYRQRVWDWYQDVFLKRLHNDSKQLMLFTRWHEDDLAGRILDPQNPCYDEKESKEWTVIALPALKEATPPLDCAKVVQDPREIGEALWESRHSREKHEKSRRINPVGFASLDQQRPAPVEGNMIKQDWFVIKKEKELPFNIQDVVWDVFIDGAWTDKKENDQTALLTCYHDKKENILYIRSCIGVRKTLDDFLKFFRGYAEGQDLSRRSTLYIEEKASGLAFKTFLKKAGFNVRGIPNKVVRYGKLNRVENAIPFLASARVVLIEGGWNAEFINQCKTFPNGKHDDMVDTLTYSIDNYFIKAKKPRTLYQ